MSAAFTRFALRVALSILVALLLPFPGPHVDRWIPVGAVLLGDEARQAPLPFFGLTFALLMVYTASAFGLLWLLQRIIRRGR